MAQNTPRLSELIQPILNGPRAHTSSAAERFGNGLPAVAVPPRTPGSFAAVPPFVPDFGESPEMADPTMTVIISAHARNKFCVNGQ